MSPTLQPVHYDPFSEEALEDPYPLYRALRDEAPVFHNAERGFWALSRYADIQAAARDWRTFANAPGVDLLGFTGFFGPGDFLDEDPPSHDELRDVVREQFIPKRIAEREAMTERHARELLDELAERDEVDVAQELALALPVRVVAELIGVPLEGRDELFALGVEAMACPTGHTDPLPAGRRALAEMKARLAALVAPGATPPEGTLLANIVAGIAAGRLTAEQANGMLVLLCVAGFETTASLLAHAVLLLDEHRDERRRLIEDPARIPDAIEEVLRLESPIQQLARTTVVEVELHGTVIPAGERVAFLYGSANRDERRYDDPDRFDVDRPRLRHLAFGEGIHHCLGAPLARQEARVAIRLLLERFPDYAVCGPLRRIPSPNARGIESLPVRLAP